MRRTSHHEPTAPDPEPAAPPAPVLLVPHLVCTLPAAAALLGLPLSCLRRAVRRGELTVSCRGGRYIVTGTWLLAWIESGQAEAEERRGRRAPADTRGRLAEARRCRAGR